MDNNIDVLTTIERVRRAFHLADLLQNKEVEELLLSQQSGDIAYRLFADAVGLEIERLAGERNLAESVSESAKEVSQLTENVRVLQETVCEMIAKIVEVASVKPKEKRVYVRRPKVASQPAEVNCVAQPVEPEPAEPITDTNGNPLCLEDGTPITSFGVQKPKRKRPPVRPRPEVDVNAPENRIIPATNMAHLLNMMP